MKAMVKSSEAERDEPVNIHIRKIEKEFLSHPQNASSTNPTVFLAQ
jgi:hypothetical protein